MTDPLAELAHHQAVTAAAADRAASELTRDDARHLRRLMADQVAMLGTLVTRTEANAAMLRDLVDAALTPDVRDVVAQLHRHRARANDLDVMCASYRAELQEYHDRVGRLEDLGDEGPEQVR